MIISLFNGVLVVAVEKRHLAIVSSRFAVQD